MPSLASRRRDDHDAADDDTTAMAIARGAAAVRDRGDPSPTDADGSSGRRRCQPCSPMRAPFPDGSVGSGPHGANVTTGAVPGARDRRSRIWPGLMVGTPGRCARDGRPHSGPHRPVRIMRTPLPWLLATVGLSLGRTRRRRRRSSAPDRPPARASAGPARRPEHAAGLGPFAPSSPPSGAFFIDAEPRRRRRPTASPDRPPARPTSPTSRSRASAPWCPPGNGTWWALADNGYGTRETSADWQLVIYRIDPAFGPNAAAAGARDGRAQRPRPTRCRGRRCATRRAGTALPPLRFNVLPATTPAGVRHRTRPPPAS